MAKKFEQKLIEFKQIQAQREKELQKEREKVKVAEQALIEEKQKKLLGQARDEAEWQYNEKEKRDVIKELREQVKNQIEVEQKAPMAQTEQAKKEAHNKAAVVSKDYY